MCEGCAFSVIAVHSGQQVKICDQSSEQVIFWRAMERVFSLVALLMIRSTQKKRKTKFL